MKKSNLILERLNLKKIPRFITKNENIDIKASEIKAENDYTIYKYVSIEDINILITNARRLDEPSKKIETMNTLSFYFDEKNKEEYDALLNVLQTTSDEEINEFSESQKQFMSELPSTIKFPKDYLWQIYYIERSNKYYMIVPIQETNQQAFIYLLKKKIENSEEKLYVPICNGKYENTYIEHTKIKKVETSLHYFTNYWPTTYEVWDKEGNIKLYITGKIKVLANIISDYKMEYTNKEDIINFYKLIDTLFYLETELANYFNFEIFLDENGKIHFYRENMEIMLENLKDFYSEEIQKNLKNIQEIQKIQISLTRKLNKNKIQEKKLNSELMYKQKQISTFLECKKTFFGKVKYFFKYSKKKKKNDTYEEEIEDMPVIESPKASNNLYDNDIKDLIFICKELKAKTLLAATTRMDLQSSDIKIDILKKKIENATLYITEIESHKKSLFEFWKYTNKDETAQLNEAEMLSKKEDNKVIEKNFNIEEDLEKFASKMDLNERKDLTNDEQNSILIANTIILKDINDLIFTGKIISENLEKIKDGINLININENIIDHREKIRSVQNFLNISPDTKIEEYTAALKNYINNLETAFSKIFLDTNLSAYGIQEPENKILKLELNPQKLINNEKEVNLYKLNLKDKSHILSFTNIIFFTNRNKTLPLGMDYSTEVLVNLKDNNIVKIKEKTNHIINLSKNSVTKLNIFEYNC